MNAMKLPENQNCGPAQYQVNLKSDFFSVDDSGATFSTDRKYRYCLWRFWDLEKPRLIFIGLNPSTANETQKDPTIGRVIEFARSWGYGGVYMLNLFAIVDKYPSVLLSGVDPLGDNDRWLLNFSKMGFDTVFAWGGFKQAEQRAYQVIPLFPEAMCLKKNKNGTPIHPLYVKGDTQPIPFR